MRIISQLPLRLIMAAVTLALGLSACSAQSVDALNNRIAAVPDAPARPGAARDGQSAALTSLLCGAGLCTDRRPAPTSEPYVISRDGGGQIISAEADREMLRQWGKRVEIRGSCRSACVIFTTLPNACLGPKLRIGFHSASVNRGFVGNQQIAKYLRAGVRDRFEREWQNVPNDQIVYITATEYKALDPQVRICGRD
ncbi:hypothetical protein EU805_07640 [Salipiger sp. IMCC34102]|uniref:hypothetical protein n=1 Tax=Salipiger sp. IMCC34102 TaxID=2510647 RepID=UPI00101CDE9B|nr:hypothetical protein [Salipiger sp. IMCC34102]RYH03573.1 hypothetical protein EU805_07640 [Salipiger sp. IMCC34102]